VGSPTCPGFNKNSNIHESVGIAFGNGYYFNIDHQLLFDLKVDPGGVDGRTLCNVNFFPCVTTDASLNRQLRAAEADHLDSWGPTYGFQFYRAQQTYMLGSTAQDYTEAWGQVTAIGTKSHNGVPYCQTDDGRSGHPVVPGEDAFTAEGWTSGDCTWKLLP
jgi:hypothetical protein